jgi:oligosaccharide repeat unit polymerase
LLSSAAVHHGLHRRGSQEVINVIALTLGLLGLYALLRVLRCDTLLVRFWCLIWGSSAALAIPLETLLWWQTSGSTLLILMLTSCLGAGAALGGGRARKLIAANPLRPPWNQQMPPALHWKIGLACLPPAYLSVHLLLRDLGQGYEVFSSVNNVVTAAAAASIARYQDDFDASALTRALNTFVFLSAFLSGWYSARKDAPRRWVLLALSSVPALAWTVLLTTKANLLFWLVYALSGYMAFSDNRLRSARAGRKTILWVVAGITLAAVMFGVQLSRIGADSLDDLAQVGETLAVAAVGHVFALRQWFYDAVTWAPQTMGARSFAGVFELMGLMPRESGLYGEQNVNVGESSTNIYSALRGLIEDFGLPLTGAAFIALGWSGAQFERRRSALARALLTVQLAWILWSPIASIFNYNSLLFASLLFALIAFVVPRPKKQILR